LTRNSEVTIYRTLEGTSEFDTYSRSTAHFI